MFNAGVFEEQCSNSELGCITVDGDFVLVLQETNTTPLGEVGRSSADGKGRVPCSVFENGAPLAVLFGHLLPLFGKPRVCQDKTDM